MSIHARPIAKIILFAILFIPLAGSIYLIIKSFIRQVLNSRFLWKKGKGRIGVFVRIVLTGILSAFGLFICFILICLFWFPDFHLAFYLKLIVFIIIIPYLGCVFSLFYGLGSAIAFGNVSSAKIFNTLFDKKSKK
jgi:hypothetical protein